MLKTLLQLKRNDVTGALKVRQEAMRDGKWKAEYDAVLMRLQDDPTALVKQVKDVVHKALPRLSDEQREEKTKKVGAKAGGASAKKVGATGKTRYTYPGEKGGDKKPSGGQPQQEQQPGAPGDPQQQQQDTLPHPDVPPPAPEQEPIAAAHPEPPPADDPRAPDPTQPAQPKHTLNVGELCAALGMQRDVLQKIAARMQKNFGENARAKFTSFMETQLKEFAQEHGLDGDYFGLLFDVLTGLVPEGAPSSAPKDQVAKPPGS